MVLCMRNVLRRAPHDLMWTSCGPHVDLMWWNVVVSFCAFMHEEGAMQSSSECLGCSCRLCLSSKIAIDESSTVLYENGSSDD